MRKIRQIIVFLLTILVSLGICTNTVTADTAPNKLVIYSKTNNNIPLRFPQNFHVKTTSDGKYVYCLTYAKNSPYGGVSYTNSSLITDNGLNYILNEAYKNANNTSNYFIYQTALWLYIQDKGLASYSYNINVFNKTVKNSNKAAAKKIKEIVANAKKAPANDTAAANLTLTLKNTTMKLSGSNYVSEGIKVTSNVTLKQSDITLTGAPAGSTAKLKNGYIYVTVPANKVTKLDNTITVTAKVAKTLYKSYNYKPSNSKYQKMSATYATTTNASKKVTLKITKTASVKVNKIDAETKKNIAGATLVLKDSKGTKITSWTSTTSAYNLTGLKEGTYTLSETATPDGYILDKTSITFKVDANGKIKNSSNKEITSISYSNKRNTVNISKQDATTSKELPGAKLVLKDSTGTVKDSWTSTSSIHVVRGLKKGTYTLSETIAPAGYKKTTTTVKFTIDEYGKLSDEKGKTIGKVVMYNEVTKVNISKQDIATSKELPGAKLVLKDANGTVKDSWTSTSIVHTVTGLSKGKYTLSETIAPAGYKKTTTTIVFNLDEYGKLTDEFGKAIDKIVMFNEVNKIDISKQDITTNKELPGAKLVLKDANGTVKDSWTSTSTVHTITGISAGSYTLEETTTPDGYVETKEKISFTIDEYGKLIDKNGKTIDKVVMYNTPEKDKEVNISKQDITTSKELPGASLEVKDENGTIIDSWISTDEVHKITGIKAGTYYLSETIAPEGYAKTTTTIKFTINKDGTTSDEKGKKIDKVVMYNELIKVNISKQDLTNKKELKGANLEVLDSERNVIDSWTSSDKVHTITGIKPGTYKLKETMAPNGYILNTEEIEFTIDEYGKITNKNGKSIDKVIMYNEIEKEIGIEISKQDIATKKELPGASLTLVGANNTIIDTWVSEDEAHVIKGIDAGTYTLKETAAPKGYKLSTETITFNVDKNGNITDTNGNKLDRVVMFNEKEEKVINISKQDIATSKELPGATLVVKNSNEEVVDSWTSTNEVHKIKGLKEGTYTLTETNAPEGYKLSIETIKFYVDSEGSLTDKFGNEKEKVVMYNTPIKTIDVTISKQDITTSKELPGATLVVKNSNEEIIDTWTSTNEVHVIKDLKEGTYTLTETNAPDGYVLSTETITFTINDKGNLTNKDGKNIDKVVMYNEKKIITSEVPIVKIDAKTKENLSGATLKIKDKDGNVVESFETTNEAHYITLQEGTYTITETKAPDGYILNDKPITFVITNESKLTDIEGNEINTIIVENTKEEIITKVSISKQDVTNGKEIPGAHLTVKDKDGNVVDSWVSTTEPHLIENLVPGTYTLNELIAPDGYILSDETITFTVKEDGSVTSVIMYNTPKPTSTPDTPNTPKPEGTEIRVENTSSKENIGISILGSISLLLGGTTITKRIKRKEI